MHLLRFLIVLSIVLSGCVKQKKKSLRSNNPTPQTELNPDEFAQEIQNSAQEYVEAVEASDEFDQNVQSIAETPKENISTVVKNAGAKKLNQAIRKEVPNDDSTDMWRAGAFVATVSSLGVMGAGCLLPLIFYDQAVRKGIDPSVKATFNPTEMAELKKSVEVGTVLRYTGLLSFGVGLTAIAASHFMDSGSNLTTSKETLRQELLQRWANAEAGLFRYFENQGGDFELTGVCGPSADMVEESVIKSIHAARLEQINAFIILAKNKYPAIQLPHRDILAGLSRKELETVVKNRQKAPTGQYIPVEFTHPDVLRRDGSLFKFKRPVFAKGSLKFKLKNGRPINPVNSKTFISGRGVLNNWGPNQMRNPVIILMHEGEPYLMLTKDSNQFSLPTNPAEKGDFNQSLIDEFLKRPDVEDLIRKDLKKPPGTHLEAKDLETYLQKRSVKGAEGPTIREGYLDDPRNTDNAWVEGKARIWAFEDKALSEKLLGKNTRGEDINNDNSALISFLPDQSAVFIKMSKINSKDFVLNTEHYVIVGDALKHMETIKAPLKGKGGTPIQLQKPK